MASSETPRQFPETAWSAILRLKDSASPEYGPSLERLAGIYWKPIYWVIRRSWNRSPDEAKDLTQEFFAEIVLDHELFRTFAPERGSFRALLRGALANFMRNVIRDAGRQKRGGGARFVSIDGDPGELAELAADSPDELFDAAWDTTVLERTLAELEGELTAAGRTDWLTAFRKYDLAAEEGPTYEALAAELGWTVRKLRRVLTHVRAAFRACALRIVREYVETPDEMRSELRALLGE